MPRGPKVGHKGTLEERLLSRVEKDRASGCWIFTGHRQKAGYGVVAIGTARNALAHRVSYELFVGPIPPDKELHHTCVNRACVNPAHLEPVTRFTHIHIEPGSMANRTHCKNGHPLIGDNLMPNRLKLGIRQCATCVRDSARRSYARNKDSKRKYAAEHRDAINDGARQRYAADPQRVLDYQREWSRKRKHGSS